MFKFIKTIGESVGAKIRGGRKKKKRDCAENDDDEKQREKKRPKREDISPAVTPAAVQPPKSREKREGGDSSKKKKRSQYKLSRSPLANLRGRPAILCTCISSRSYKKALGEAWDLFDDAIDELYPRKEPKDLAAAAKLPQRFIAHDIDCDAVLYFTFNEHNIDVVRIVRHILLNYSQRSQLLARMIPLSTVCYASKDDVIDALGPLLIGLEGKSYAIDMKRRNNDIFPRDEAIQAIALCVPKRSYRVDLDKPDSTICVHIFKSLAGISVVPGFYDLLILI